MSAPAWLIRRLRIMVKDPARALAIPSTATDPNPHGGTAAVLVQADRWEGDCFSKGDFFFFFFKSARTTFSRRPGLFPHLPSLTAPWLEPHAQAQASHWPGEGHSSFLRLRLPGTGQGELWVPGMCPLRLRV